MEKAGTKVDFEAVEAAAARIAPHIRRTPTIVMEHVRDRPVPNPVHIKLECLQVTGAFKARGVTNRLLTTSPGEVARGIVTASGGNHGLAVARAGKLAGVEATVYLPPSASPAKRREIARWGARVEVVGPTWDDADRAAERHAEREGAVYVHPFKDPQVVAGQGTAALEMAREVPQANVYVIAIGGGGLIAGFATVLATLNPRARIVGVEPVGSPTLARSLAEDRTVRLDSVTTRVATMACGQTSELILDLVRGRVSDVALVEDAEMEAAARWIRDEFAIRADLSSAATFAALALGRVRLDPGEVVCTLICGADDAALAGE